MSRSSSSNPPETVRIELALETDLLVRLPDLLTRLLRADDVLRGEIITGVAADLVRVEGLHFEREGAELVEHLYSPCTPAVEK